MKTETAIAPADRTAVSDAAQGPPTLSIYLALGFFVGLAALFGLQDKPAPVVAPDAALFAISCLGVAFHLALLPVVASLPGRDWAKASGYGWIVVDIVSNVMAINGVADAQVLGVRLGGHIAAAVWIAAVSYGRRGSTRVLGLGLALWLFGYSFAAPWVPDAAFTPAVPLMIGWLWTLTRTPDRSVVLDPVEL
jgi:hypothetical protein